MAPSGSVPAQGLAPLEHLERLKQETRS